MIDQHDWDRLGRFVAGECTAEEAEAIARWADETAERRDALAFIRVLGVATEAGRPAWDTVASWDRLVARRQTRERLPLQLTPTAVRRLRPRWWWAAAALIVLVGGGGLWRRQYASESRLAAADALPAGRGQEHVTAPGERSAFQLPDGTPVTLAAASRLWYSASFNASHGRRDVYLEGKALFQVKHDERRPFVVHTAHGITEDVGTRFTVQEYAGDTAVEVLVTEGRVDLRSRSSAGVGARLRPGELGRLAHGGDAVVQTGVDLDRYLAWTQGRLVFEDTPLRDALPELSRWYGLNFTVADTALGSRHLSTVLSGEAVTETLKLLSSTLDIGYEQHGRTVAFVRRSPR